MTIIMINNSNESPMMECMIHNYYYTDARYQSMICSIALLALSARTHYYRAEYILFQSAIMNSHTIYLRNLSILYMLYMLHMNGILENTDPVLVGCTLHMK